MESVYIDHTLEVRTGGIVAWFVRRLFLCRVPILSRLIIIVYAKIMKADYYGHKPEDFDCLLSFFLRQRDLSVKSRGLELVHTGVCPAEGKVTFLDVLTHNDTMPVKGAGFTVSKLIGRDAPEYESGLVIYLAPGNYHHVHSPADMVIEDYYEVAGKLESVAPALLKNNPMLYAENLRHVLIARTVKGARLALVFVGAKNVGGIFCPKLAGWEPGQQVSYKKGEAVGFFSLGSTVVLLAGGGIEWIPHQVGQPVDVMDEMFEEKDVGS